MPRRALLLVLFAIFAITACNTTPAAPPLTDPKEILVKSVTSLKDIKTVQIHGTFEGTVEAPGMGSFDLKSVSLDLSADLPAKKLRLMVDAPSLLGTNIDAIVLEDAAYVKMAGMLAGFLGLGSSGDYTKFPIGAEEGTVPEDATDPAKAIEELRKSLDKLPRAPEKLADEKCGDTDCYHIRIALDAADLKSLSPEAGSEVSNVALDLLVRRNDLRPGRLSFSVDAAELGTVTANFEMRYDGGVDIKAPPDDQITEASPGL